MERQTNNYRLKAVMTGIDTKPAESLALMLESVGYEVFMLTDKAMEGYSKGGYKGGARS